MKIYFKSDNSTVYIPCTSGDDGCPPVYDGPTAVTPGAADVVLPTRGTSMIQDITVTGDPDLIPENIVQNVDIFGVQGAAVIPSLGALSVTANGTYTAPQGTGYDEVNVAVPGSTGTKSITITENGTTTEDVAAYANAEITVAVPASEVDSGTKSITTNGNNQDVVGYAAADVNVPNSYTAGDEGKVVSNGALVAQTSDTVTQNGTVDTTLINSLTVNVSGGGGGLTTIASGTFVGNNNTDSTADGGRQLINIGTKMAQTDFYVFVYAPNGSEFVKNTSRQMVWLHGTVRHELGAFNLSSTGTKDMIPAYSADSNDGGTITTRNAGDIIRNGKQMYNGSISDLNSFNYFKINRKSDHFELWLGVSNAVYIFPSSITYNYEVVYFGSNPSVDIVEIS